MFTRDELDSEWYSLDNLHNIKVNDKVYYAQCFPTQGTFEILELKVARIRCNNEESYFVGTETRDKHSYLFYYGDIGKTIFLDRNECLKYVTEIQKLHKGEIVSDEKYYEED